MRLKSYLLFCIVTFSLIGIRLSIALDNPEHILIPDSNCSICQAYNSPVFVELNAEVSAISVILAFLNEQSQCELYFTSNILKNLIRAPPTS